MTFLCIPLLALGIISAQIQKVEKYTFLPYSSDYCKERQDAETFSLTQHMTFKADKYDRLKTNISHICHVLVSPSGRIVEAKSNDQIVGTFWHLRFKINITDCNTHVEISYFPDSFQSNLSKESQNLSCSSEPYIIDAEHRRISFKLHSPNQFTTGVSIDFSSYLRYNSDYSLKTKITECEKNVGFWCKNTEVCLYPGMRCDQGDGCFDGGSDEENCKSFSIPTNGHIPNYAGDRWSPYIPWTATLLVLIPVLVILILRLFSVHKRSFGDFDSLSQNEYDPVYLDGEDKHGNLPPGHGSLNDKPSRPNFDNNDDSDYSMEKHRGSLNLISTIDSHRDSSYLDDDEKRMMDSGKLPILINSSLNIIKEDEKSDTSPKEGKHVHYEEWNGNNPDFYVKRISDGSTISKEESGFFTDTSSSGAVTLAEGRKSRLKQTKTPYYNQKLEEHLINV